MPAYDSGRPVNVTAAMAIGWRNPRDQEESGSKRQRGCRGNHSISHGILLLIQASQVMGGGMQQRSESIYKHLAGNYGQAAEHPSKSGAVIINELVLGAHCPGPVDEPGGRDSHCQDQYVATGASRFAFGHARHCASVWMRL
jgi:hypothetical protein